MFGTFTRLKDPEISIFLQKVFDNRGTIHAYTELRMITKNIRCSYYVFALSICRPRRVLPILFERQQVGRGKDCNWKLVQIILHRLTRVRAPFEKAKWTNNDIVARRATIVKRLVVFAAVTLCFVDAVIASVVLKPIKGAQTKHVAGKNWCSNQTTKLEVFVFAIAPTNQHVITFDFRASR